MNQINFIGVQNNYREDWSIRHLSKFLKFFFSVLQTHLLSRLYTQTLPFCPLQLSLSLSPSLSFSLSLTHTPPHTHTHSVPISLILNYSLSISLTFNVFPKHFISVSLCLSLSVSVNLSLSSSLYQSLSFYLLSLHFFVIITHFIGDLLRMKLHISVSCISLIFSYFYILRYCRVFLSNSYLLFITFFFDGWSVSPCFVVFIFLPFSHSFFLSLPSSFVLSLISFHSMLSNRAYFFTHFVLMYFGNLNIFLA